METLQSADRGRLSGWQSGCPAALGAVFSRGIAGEGGAVSREPGLIFGAGFHPHSSWVEKWGVPLPAEDGKCACLRQGGPERLCWGLRPDAALSRPHGVTRPQALVLRPALAPLRLLDWGLGSGDLTPPSARAPPRGSLLEVLVGQVWM